MMSRADGQLAQTSGVGILAVVVLYLIVCWVCQPRFQLVWRVSVAVGALCVLVCRVGLVARRSGLIVRLVVEWPLWSGERTSEPGSVDSAKRLRFTLRDASRVTDLAVYSSCVVKVAPNSRESLGLFGHERSPFLGVAKEHGAEPLLAVMPGASPAAPHRVADLHRGLMALLPV